MQPWLQWCGRATLHPALMGCMPGTVLWRAKSDKIEDVNFRSDPHHSLLIKLGSDSVFLKFGSLPVRVEIIILSLQA